MNESTNLAGVKIILVFIQCRLIIVYEAGRLFVLVILSEEQCEEDCQTQDLGSDQLIRLAFEIVRMVYFEWLNEHDRREETAQQGREPFLNLHIAELDSAHDDEENRNHCQNQ